MDEIILGPDVYVNASVALGSPPEHVVRRVLGGDKPSKTSDWIIGRIEAILTNLDAFKPDMVEGQLKTIRGLVDIVEKDEHPFDDWTKGLVAAAKAAKFTRVVTDHPDLADTTEVDGIEFISSDAWLVEVTTPPPPPGS